MELIDRLDKSMPPGAVVDMVEAGGARLRVARWAAPTWTEPTWASGRGTVVVLPGRTEFIEKYGEVARDLIGRGFGVVVIDWRGQGGSSRLLPDRRKGHIGSFDEYRADLDAVAIQVLTPHCPRPWFALGHSMGGAIVIDHAAHGGDLFDRIVLSAPMIDLYGKRMIGLKRLLARMTTAAGLGSAYIPGGSGECGMTRPFEGNVLTSDRLRYQAFATLAHAAPDLLLGSPTFGWAHAAFVIMRSFERPALAARITTPTLVVACGDDRVVDTPVIERFARSLKTGHLIVVPHARHEVLMERDPLREQFWAAFDQFIPGSSPAPAVTTDGGTGTS